MAPCGHLKYKKNDNRYGKPRSVAAVDASLVRAEFYRSTYDHVPAPHSCSRQDRNAKKLESRDWGSKNIFKTLLFDPGLSAWKRHMWNSQLLDTET
jgi:hypothetical protein